ncbi:MULTISPECIES: DUF6503 family protein [Nonlabens]|uniref:DUF6503 family protein n=1 Tax=Nonlabens TaxID=363408 RepID=UPI003264FF7A
MKLNLLTLLLCFLLLSCNDNKNAKTPQEIEPAPTQEFQNKGHEMVYQMVQKVGDYQKLLEKKDVSYTLNYQTADGKLDVTNEKYIFDGELSYGYYHKHERTLPDLDGIIEQGFDGSDYWLKNNEEQITEQKYLDKVKFNRPTNFYWFAMMPKLLDNNLVYEYVESKTIDNKEYDVVKVSFNLAEKKATDIYQVYINKETGLVDQFLFTVADYNIIETPALMQVEYENIEGVLLPTTRKYKKSSWDAIVTDAPWVKVNWSDIKFNNGLVLSDFQL